MLKNKKKPLNNFAKYSSMAFQMGVIVFAGAYGGVKLDEYLGLKFNAFTVSFSILSVILAVYLFIKDLMKIDKK